MRTGLATMILVVSTLQVLAQEKLEKLSVEKIMRDPKWIGSSPSAPQWSADGKSVFFLWNPTKEEADSFYFITAENKVPQKATVEQKRAFVGASSVQYNRARSAWVYAKEGDIFLFDAKSNSTRRITETIETESNPQFSFFEKKIVFVKNQNLFAWDIASGETLQLSNLKTVPNPSKEEKQNDQESWLKSDQLRNFDVLRSRKEKKDSADAYNKITKQKELRTINLEDKILQGLSISPDGRFISYRLNKPATTNKTTIVPNFVTESGFTTDIPARTKVGEVPGTSDYFIYDRERDSVFIINTDSIEGIHDLPSYLDDYPRQKEERKKANAKRNVSVTGIYWSAGSQFPVLEIHAGDHKDRWLMLWDTASHRLRLVDRQHDDAWIGGPGSFGNIGWIDEHSIWFQSEATGYSHLYVYNTVSDEKKTLTAGLFEVQRVQLSNDRKYFYITTNETHPGEQHFYRLSISSGKKEKISSQTGANQVSVSPDEKNLVFLYSYSNKPWELFWQQNKRGAQPEQVTFQSRSDEFNSYPWRDPEVVSFAARDGARVYARLYRPAAPGTAKPAVIFVHGAGYLQNAHKWWSSYFREYMFNNMLADNGYVVFDIDYRGSAGYGRDWRTGIYRHMGGRDLADQVDAANYLVKSLGVDPKRIGIYGGSYGGFITLMGLFTEPNIFAAGAALRPVTDWANYNQPYTSNILNEPFNDSIAYRKSSPIYFAEGLKGDLLICHGMVDVNVHYQDAVKLTQRLIELGKDNWELASYPMEDHGFVEPSSWTDEYKRIFKLFERVLKR
jgi:dipeptidyl aminopeptidase/acylaminoacyl peptidase